MSLMDFVRSRFLWVSGTQEEVEERIKECGEKSSQMLLFLSFAILGAATLSHDAGPIFLRDDAILFRKAMLWWAGAGSRKKSGIALFGG
jgi:hypothetical protein